LDIHNLREKGPIVRLLFSFLAFATALLCADAVLFGQGGNALTPQVADRTGYKSTAGRYEKTSIDGTGKVSHLGAINFPNSCSSQVSANFNEGVALLDSFQYDLSSKDFANITRKDPHCAMAYWGEAMSLYHQLWKWPDAQELQQGYSYIRTAEELSASTERERAYIQAAAIYFQVNPKIDGESRAVAYSEAMAELYSRFPEDDNAASLYALSLIAVRSPDKTANMSRRLKAIDILEKLYRESPDNPGVAHYLIHATDTPELAHLGLDAARRYAKIAPDAPHALHMPSHIFTDLGMWQESIQSNLTSAAAAQKITQSDSSNDSADQLHALSFLEYAYLQTGRDTDARNVIKQVRRVPGASSDDIANYETMFWTAYLAETHRWKEAAAFVPAPESYPMLQVQAYAVRAIGEARTGDVANANSDVEHAQNSYKAMQAAMKRMNMGTSDAGRGSDEGVDQLIAEAWLAYASGKQDEALSKMNAAVDIGGSSVRMGGVPGIPAREMLGDLLLELHRPSEALAAYVSVLKESPSRFNSLYGAARAAQLAGNPEAAQGYFAELRKICGTSADRADVHKRFQNQ
jgi:hypothetical protein